MHPQLKELISAELIFASFSDSNSRKLIPQNFLKMSNSRKLVPRKINSTIFFPEKIQKWHEKLVNYKNRLVYLPIFRNSRKLIPQIFQK